MNSISFPVLLILLAAGPVPAQKIDLLSLTPVPGELPGTTTVRIVGSVPSGGEHVLEDSADLSTWNRVSPVLNRPDGLLDWSLRSGPAFVRQGIPYPDIPNSPAITWYQRRFYRLRALPPAQAAPATLPILPQGRLWQSAADAQFYLTTKANWRILIRGSEIVITAPDLKNKWECWGEGLHENLNGKHVKDWTGRRRTILLPGDTLITLTSGEKLAGSGKFTLQSVSIYDADQSHRVNTHNNTVEMSLLGTRVGEAAEPDGETMRFWHLGGGRYYGENIYTQEAAGGTLPVQTAIPLGSTGGETNPTQVNDYYDDTRLAAT